MPLVVPGLSTSSGSVSSSASPPQESSRREVVTASGNSRRSVSSSSSGPVLERSDEIASRTLVRSSKTQNKMKRGMTEEIRMTRWHIFRSVWRTSQMIWRTQNCMHPHTVLRTQIRNVLRKWQQNPGSTAFILTSQKTELAKSA